MSLIEENKRLQESNEILRAALLWFSGSGSKIAKDALKQSRAILLNRS